MTYKYDRVRGALQGIVEVGFLTYVLLIAIRYFEAPESVKATLSAAGFVGLLLNPFTVGLVSALGIPANRANVGYYLVSSCFMVGAVLAGSLEAYALCAVLAAMTFMQQTPLMIHIYSQNYRPRERGSRLSSSFALGTMSAGVFAYAAGRLLDYDISAWPVVIGMMAVASCGCAWALWRIPSNALDRVGAGNPWRNVGLVFEDKLFGWMLLSWFFVGLGNLITVPIRVEYLADPSYGVNASNGQIGLINVALPAITMLASLRLWGRVFDYMHFPTVRILINCCFIAGFILFFSTTNLWLMGVGMALVGFALGGGKLSWALWVTKVAPKERVSAYMSVHSALSGVRGTLAPYLGYVLLTSYGPRGFGVAAVGLVLLSSLMFALVFKNERFADHA